MLKLLKETDEGPVEGVLVSVFGWWYLVRIERRNGCNNIMAQSYDMRLADLLNLLEDQGWEVMT